jgi:hypothetical protein
MKLLIILTVVAFSAIFANDNATPLPPATSSSISSSPNAIIKVKLKFGKKSSGCTRTGVCSFETEGPIDIDISVVEPNTGKGTATMASGKLVVNFAKSSMSNDVIAKHFANNEFVVEEPYKIELENTLVSSYTIRRGTYEVRENGKMLTVEF